LWFELGSDSGDVGLGEHPPVTKTHRWLGDLTAAQQVNDSVRFAAKKPGYVAKQTEILFFHALSMQHDLVFLS
jgi:hypothetical protein